MASTIFPIKKSAKFALPVLASPPLLLRWRKKERERVERWKEAGKRECIRVEDGV